VEVAFHKEDPPPAGALLGSTLTTKTPAPGEFEEVSVQWNDPVEGTHVFRVVADPQGKVQECRRDNNTAPASFSLGGSGPPSTMLPGLAVSAEDVALVPAGPIEGQPASILALVRNLGTSSASDVTVSFFDDAPQADGTFLGSVTKAALEPGASTLAEIPWNTFGQSGRNYLHILVDPEDLIEESNEENNSTILSRHIVPPTLPDLAVSSTDILFSLSDPEEGDPLRVGVTVHNLLNDDTHETLKTLVEDCLTHVHREREGVGFLPNELIPVKIELMSSGTSRELLIEESYPQEIRLWDPAPGEWVAQNPWGIDLHLDGDEEKTLLFYARTPDQEGSYCLETRIFPGPGGGPPDQTLQLTLDVLGDKARLARDILEMLGSLSVSRMDLCRLQRAVFHVRHMELREVRDRRDAERAIRDALDAAESLSSITSSDVTEVREKLAGLLRSWEAQWYFMGCGGTRGKTVGLDPTPAGRE